MTAIIGQNRNSSDSATVTKVTVGDTTAVTLSAANDKRVAWRCGICSTNGTEEIKVAYVRYYAAATDNNKVGEPLAKFMDDSGPAPFVGAPFISSPHVMTPDNIYTGEISAITESGSVDLYVTEY